MSKTTNFIAKIKDYAIKDMNSTGVLASLTIAQAILESAWGESTLSVKGNNLFGIKKGNWSKEVITLPTKEYIKGQWITVQADFRKYNNWGESIADHSYLLLGDRYKSVISAKDYKTACYNIAKCGYATDPNYPTLLIELIEQFELYKYDNIKTNNISNYAENGQATVLVDVLNVRNTPTTKELPVAKYYKGGQFNYDSVYINDGYVWCSYISNSGYRRYVASRTINNMEIYLKCV